MRRQGPPRRLLPGVLDHHSPGLGGLDLRCHFVLGHGFLELGQLQLELIEQSLAALAGLTECRPPGLGEQELEPLDLERGRRHHGLSLLPGVPLRQDHRMRGGKVVRQDGRRVLHTTNQAQRSFVLKT